MFPSSDAPQRKKTRSASPSQPRSVGPPSGDSAPPTSATTTPSQPTPPQTLTESAPHGGQRGGGAGQEFPSGTSSHHAAIATATGTDSQECVPVQHHETSSNAESYDFTVSCVQPPTVVCVCVVGVVCVCVCGWMVWVWVWVVGVCCVRACV